MFTQPLTEMISRKRKIMFVGRKVWNRVPFCRLLLLAGLRWRYSNPPPHETQVICKDSNRTSQETHYISATKPTRLILFSEIVAAYYENRKEYK
jgi:hypothetical protein